MMTEPHPRLKAILKFLKTNEVAITIGLGFLLIVSVALIIIGKNWWQEIRQPSIDQQAASIISTDTNQLPAIKKADGLTAPTEYIVKKGDSTWKIAQLFYDHGESYPAIEQANHLKHNQQLEIGQRLIIPVLEVQSAPTSPTSQTDYVIKTGDCLWTIAQNQLGSGYRWVDIYRANKIMIGRNPNLIYPATVLHLPNRD